QTDIITFGERRVLVVERFDRQWLPDGRLLRLPQEDCCQALGVPPSRKYQANAGGLNGPGIVDIISLLRASDEPVRDQADFFKSQIIFWLIGATDGHAKNFSIFLRPGGGFQLTPFYDVLTAQTAFDAKQIPHAKFKLAMSVGQNRKYSIVDIVGRHFVQTGKEAGIGPAIMKRVITEVLEAAEAAPDLALAQMPGDFAEGVHSSVREAISSRVRLLQAALSEM